MKLRSGAVASVAVTFVALIATFGATMTTAKPVASAGEGPTEAVVDGRGWGHGRGLGQYGAFGYARDLGWGSARILDHFYGGTTAGQAPVPGVVDPGRVRVELVAMTGRATTVALRSGTLRVLTSGGTELLARDAGAVRLTGSDGGFGVEVAPGCDGPWTAADRIEHDLVRLTGQSNATDHNGLLEVCGPTNRVWYDGELQATVSGGRQRTINVVTVEQYLRGVVPNEVPALWPNAVLEAQAVAARSYALTADPRSGSFSDTCDTSRCQVYDGRYTTRGGGLRLSTHPRTDAAVAATAGQVRLTSSGRVARTEFSSSTGGYTAGGDFPAVVDEGDSIDANGNSTWTETIDLTSLERTNGKGPLLGIEVTSRNGLGPDGGRVTELTYRFRDGDVTVSGSVARVQLGLKSDWFTIRRLTRGGVAIDDPAATEAFVEAAYGRLGGRPPTAAERDEWSRRVPVEGRAALADELVRGGHFAGQLVDGLYLASLGRRSDDGGRRYWVEQVRAGLGYESMGTLFLGSPEYVRRAGGGNAAFVDALYRDVLGRRADKAGRDYWTGLLDSGRAAPVDVASAFFRGRESRRDRAGSLHARVIGTRPAGTRLDELADRLLAVDDFVLAAELATSSAFPTADPTSGQS